MTSFMTSTNFLSLLEYFLSWAHHSKLLPILQTRFSVTGQPQAWFRSYLMDRTQVTTQFSHKPPIPLTYGIPRAQASALRCSSVTLRALLHFPTHTVQYHLFADSTQSYGHSSVAAVPSLLTRLSSCVADLANSYASLRLQLNPAETGFTGLVMS